MKKYFILLVILFGTLFFSCSKEATNTKQPVVSFTTSEKALLQSSNEFGLDLFKDLADDLPTTNNMFISPLSVYLALTMAYNGAAGETAIEMQNTLGYSGMNNLDINISCKALVEKILNADPQVIMEIANSIWYRNTFEVKDSFLSLNRNYFNAEVKPANFEDPATVGLINSWVKAKTHDKIDKVINEISPLTMMYLINAIYFKGVWKHKFNKTASEINIFHRSDTDTSMVVFMEQESNYNYIENATLKAVELPYGNAGFSMVVLLPAEGKTVGNIISEFTPANWRSWNQEMDSTRLVVNLPRFKFAYDTLLNESLKTLGMPKAFQPRIAGFTKINDAYDLYISSVLHKSFVEVNEEGTEAAAVTVIEFGITSINPPVQKKYFVANKPFIFLIKENSTQTILFAGIMNKPVYE